ncbi:AI-2E family transporter [[Ruminococcus] gnavus]|uniref:AI-2E family transporter n=1 Tax=Mediterraneibacter gnavus TaxID=33038 RepID=A0AAJ1GAF5_MEDGN|nr:AI-2E family transporter [Mediterraneibacter gnavus]MCZ0688652.1 AI-2E family transporter [Mediterraneibacter gnavus]
MNREEEKPEKEGKKENDYYTSQPSFGNKKTSRFWHQISRDVRIFVVIAACIVFYFALLRMTNISEVFGKIYQVLKPIIYGLVIAYLLNPIVKLVDTYFEPWIKRKFPRIKNAGGISRGAGILLAIVVMFALIVALCNMMIPELYRSIRDMILTVPSQLNRFIGKMTEVMSTDQSTIGQMAEAVLKEASDALQTWMRTDLLNQVNVLMSNLTVGVINIVKELCYVLIGVIVSVYVLFSKEKFASQCKKLVYAIMRPSRANMVLHLTIKSNEIFGGFIIGKIIDSAIIGVLCFVGLSILDMPYTMLVSVIVGVTNVIPFFGPYIGAIPSAVLILLSDPKMGIYFIVFVFLLQQLDGNIIGPKILGDSTGLSAFWVVFSILFGGGMFGFVGMILGVPTFAVIYYIVKMLVNHQLENHTLPTDTGAYDQFGYVNNEGEYARADEATEKKEEKGE